MSNAIVTNALSGGRASGLPDWVPWAIALALLAFLAILGIVVYLRRREKVEDPARLKTFFEIVRPLDWSKGQVGVSMDTLNSAVIDLFQAEVRYYYQTRIVRRRTSSLFRWAAFLFGTAGLVCPLLETAVPVWAGVSRLGYVLLAVAAASLAGNELFGGTRGHVRTVTAQYQVESVLNRHVIAWSEWRSGADDPEDWKAGFAILKKLSEDIYATLLEETRQWGSAVMEAESVYRSGMSSGPGNQGGEGEAARRRDRHRIRGFALPQACAGGVAHLDTPSVLSAAFTGLR